MNHNDAMAAVARGAIVARESWEDGIRVMNVETLDEVGHETQYKVPGVDPSIYTGSDEEKDATDWTVVSEEGGFTGAVEVDEAPEGAEEVPDVSASEDAPEGNEDTTPPAGNVGVPDATPETEGTESVDDAEENGSDQELNDLSSEAEAGAEAPAAEEGAQEEGNDNGEAADPVAETGAEGEEEVEVDPNA